MEASPAVTEVSAAAAALPMRAGVATIGWVRGLPYDVTLIGGVAALALATAGALVMRPELFIPLLFLDTWVLGYHHVIATFTRLTFDTESLRAHRFLALGLPRVMLAATFAFYLQFGGAMLVTVYFYWQWFHYMRQSYGIERLYWRKAGMVPGETLNKALLYSTATWGIAQRSAQGMPFLGIKLQWIPVPTEVVTALGVVSGALFVWWLGARIREYRRGELALAHSAFVLSHVVVFVVGYIVMADVTHGWLVLNVWHNAQYLLIVWLFNANRFKAGVDPAHRFLSTLSQPRNAVWYVATLAIITLAVYVPLDRLTRWLVFTGVPVALVVSQGINFHHYIADAVIWKLRRAPIRAQLGV
jgi:hypothetical protein